MAEVIEVLETSDGVDGGASLESGFRGTRTFRVLFDGANKSTYAATNASDGTITIPPYTEAHPDEPTAYAVEKTGRPLAGENGWVWDVSVRYTRPTVNADAPDGPDGTGPGGGQTPEAGSSTDPIPHQKLKWGTYPWTYAANEDALLNPMVNAAGDAFDPVQTRELNLPELTITRTQRTFNPLWAASYRDTVNEDPFMMGGIMWPEGTLFVAMLEGDWPTGPNNNLWEVVIKIRVNLEGHQWRLLNAGWNQLVDGKRKPIMLGPLKPTVQQPLAEDGTKLPIGGTPNYLEFTKYFSSDFAGLQLNY